MNEKGKTGLESIKLDMIIEKYIIIFQFIKTIKKTLQVLAFYNTKAVQF